MIAIVFLIKEAGIDQGEHKKDKPAGLSLPMLCKRKGPGLAEIESVYFANSDLITFKAPPALNQPIWGSL